MSAVAQLRAIVDLPGLHSRLLKDGEPYGWVLDWYVSAAEVLDAHVATGAATADDARTVRAEIMHVLAAGG